MTPHEVLSLANDYGITAAAVAFLLIVLGNMAAAWLTQAFLPMRLKKHSWKWEKEQWATEQFLESLSRVEFMGKHLVRSEAGEKVSLSRLSFNETEAEIVKVISDLHSGGHRIRPYLNQRNQALFDDYLQQSSAAFDASKASHGEWMQDDYAAEEDHRLSFIHEQSLIAGRLIGKVEIA
ncbi:MAG: hypothetical protein L6Q55_09160 [Azonexus sp.]|nr:hypothetical protein [Azonexus sp.]MCK6412574.1 hypothetical protein [Azonexus sp.]